VTGLDTNILVRYLAQDDPVQSRQAARILERDLTEANPGFLSLVTIAETVWVLKRAYALADAEIVSALERVLQADTLVVQNEQEVFIATRALKDGGASFADALIGALGKWAGCDFTLTFE
jgi:predicted nucleic-acid-binding protein